MHLRHGSLFAGGNTAANRLLDSPRDLSQNPDSSSSIDITDVEERKEEMLLEDERVKERKIARKANVMLVRQKEEVSSSEKDMVKPSRSSNTRHSDVWRPY